MREGERERPPALGGAGEGRWGDTGEGGGGLTLEARRPPHQCTRTLPVVTAPSRKTLAVGMQPRMLA